MTQIAIVTSKDSTPIPVKMKKFHEKAKHGYKPFTSLKELEAYFEKHGALWATYSATEFDVTNMDHFNDKQKESFRSYISGWVQYYDEITRNSAISHVLYFKWNSDNVQIYMCPKPNESDHPIKPPGTTTDPKSPSAPPPPYP